MSYTVNNRLLGLFAQLLGYVKFCTDLKFCTKNTLIYFYTNLIVFASLVMILIGNKISVEFVL
jgi:hypothetical protein